MRSVYIVMMMIFGACQQQGSKGNEGPNGGDVVAQQAATIVAAVVEAVESSPGEFPEIDMKYFRETAQRTRIIVRERTFANGVETDATNTGPDLIELNGTRWPNITDEDRRMALIFHELLGLIGLEKNSYGISSRLLGPENRLAKEQTFNCQWSGIKIKNCTLSLRYDRSQKAVVVRDQNCLFFRDAQSFFYKHNRKLFYIEKPCVDPDNPPPPGTEIPCKAEMAPRDIWSSLKLLDGGRYLFEGAFGAGLSQLSCVN